MTTKTPKFLTERLDRVAITLIAVMAVIMGLLVLGGDHTAPRIRDFSWEDRQVGAEDTAFLLTFSRPMNHESVENNLRVEPPLPGKFSWAGRRMAYTLETPAPYGTDFKVQIQGARDRFSQPQTENLMPPFEGQFRTRDRAFVYLGVQGEEAGRLVLENLSKNEHRILTPANLSVMDYKPYPEGDRILFSASNREGDQIQSLLDQKLYTVTTGIQIVSPAKSPTELKTGENPEPVAAQPPGVVELVVDSKDYQNLKFDLSPNGEIIIVQRVNRQNPAEFGLWQIRQGQAPSPLETEPGGDFLIAPDSSSLAMSQGQGMAILPLESGADPLDFLSKFGVVLSFARDGSAAAMVKFNRDPNNPTRSLFLVTNTGVDKELVKTDGSFLSAQFSPNRQILYVLMTRRLPGDQFVEQPYIAAINLENSQITKLLDLPVQRDVQMSLAPDGLALIFDQVQASDQPPTQSSLIGSDGKAIATSRLWALPLLADQAGNSKLVQPQELPLLGLRPRWLP